MNNQPGLSIFQGSEPINLNASLSRQEEEEAREDELKRKEELKNLLENAFDDLDEEIERSSINSSQNPNYSVLDRTNQNPSKDIHIYNIEGNFQDKYTNYPNEITPPYQHNKKDIYTIGNYNNNEEMTSNEYILNRNNRFGSVQNYTNTPKSAFIGAGDCVSPNSSNYLAMNENGNPCISAHINHCFKKNKSEEFKDDDQNSAYRKSEYNSTEQLEVLLEVRLREVQRLTEQIQAQEEDHAKDKENMFRKCALLEAELERIKHSKEESQKKLVSKDIKLEELHKETEKYKLQNENYEKQNKQLTLDLETMRLSHTDLQHRLTLLQKDRLPEKHMDSYIKSIQDRYEKQIKSLEYEVEAFKSKLNMKNQEYESISARLIEVTRSHETLLIEKGDIINQLMRNLEISQSQCSQLMASNLSQENIKLKMQLDEAKVDRDRFSEKLVLIATELEATKEELKSYERVAALGVMNTDMNTDSIIQLGLKNDNPGNTELFDKLKEEIQQLLSGNKLKRDEILRLNNVLETKNNQIDQLKNQEESYIKEIINLKENLQITQNIYKLNKDNKDVAYEDKNTQCSLNTHMDNNDTLRELSESQKTILELEEINRNLKEQLESQLKEMEQIKKKVIDEYNSEYLQFHDRTLAKVRSERDSQLHKQIIDLSVQLEEALKENQHVKELYVELCKTKESLVLQLKTEQETISNLRIRLNDIAEKLTNTSNQAMVVENTTISSLNGQLITVQDRIHELIVQLRGEQELSQRLSLELDATKAALGEANKRLLESPGYNNNQGDVIEKMQSMEKIMKEKFEDYKNMVSEYKKTISNLKSERDMLREKLKTCINKINQLEEQLKHKTNINENKSANEDPAGYQINRPICIETATSPLLPNKDINLENKTKQLNEQLIYIKNNLEKYYNENKILNQKINNITSERNQLINYIKNKSNQINEIQIRHQEKCSELDKERKLSQTIKKLASKYRDTTNKLTNQLNLMQSVLYSVMKKIEKIKNIDEFKIHNEYLMSIDSQVEILEEKLKNM